MNALAALFFWLMMTLGVRVSAPTTGRQTAPTDAGAAPPSAPDDGSADWLDAIAGPHISNGF